MTYGIWDLYKLIEDTQKKTEGDLKTETPTAPASPAPVTPSANDAYHNYLAGYKPPATSTGITPSTGVNPSTGVSPGTTQFPGFTKVEQDGITVYYDSKGNAYQKFSEIVPTEYDGNGNVLPGTGKVNEYLELFKPADEEIRTYPAPGGVDVFWDENGLLNTWSPENNEYIPGQYDPTKDQNLLRQQNLDTWNQSQAATNLELEQQRLAQDQQQFLASQEADRQQRLATLKANPASWLEYSAASGQTPAVQPWMLPLMPQQYLQSVKSGDALPGWQQDQESAVGKLPELTSPSNQYMARLNPSSKSQYYGYQQANTGATPEDTQYKLWNTSPGTGQTSKIKYA